MPRQKGTPLSPAELSQRRDAAQKSTGPRTDRGKQISAMNGWKDGSAARSVRSSVVGKPCLSTCPKHPCVWVNEKRTQPGGKCLDVIDWNVIEESADAIVEAQAGSPEKLQGLSAMLMGQSVAVIQQIFSEIQTRGVWISEDVINAEGEVVGTKEKENPLIDRMSKMMEKLGINLPEFMATPKAIAQGRTDDEQQQTAAEFTRQIGRLIPESMRVPAFDPSEITDAEVVPDAPKADQ